MCKYAQSQCTAHNCSSEHHLHLLFCHLWIHNVRKNCLFGIAFYALCRICITHYHRNRTIHHYYYYYYKCVQEIIHHYCMHKATRYNANFFFNSPSFASQQFCVKKNSLGTIFILFTRNGYSVSAMMNKKNKNNATICHCTSE